MSTPTLAGAAARGVFFTLSAQAAKILIQLLSVIVLSRLLSPTDYGLLAIVLVVVAFGEIFRDFGLTSASVQAEVLSRGQRDNLFWINTAIGLLLAIVMFALADVLAAIVQEPAVAPIAQALAVVFFLNGVATQYRATLMRELRFRALASIDVASAAIALIAGVLAAVAGWEYWALVVQQLVMGTAAVIGVIAASRWLPRLPSRHSSVRDIVKFGWSLVATNILTYFGSQTDTIVVGLRFGVAPLGLYSRAFQLVMTPLSQIRSPLTTVALPVLSRMQEEPDRFARYIVAGQLGLGYGLGVPLALAVGLSSDVIAVFLGPQWSDAAPIVSLFAVAGILHTLSYVGYWIYLARGLGPQLFRFTLLTTGIKIACILIGSLFGFVGVAVGFAVAPMISWPLSLFWLSRLTPTPVRALYAGAFRILGLVAAVAGVSYWSGELTSALPAWASLILGIAAGFAVAGVALVLRMYRLDLKLLRDFARLVLKSPRDRAPGKGSV
ncbi:lipopolysaccharide biosynthesis protein [Mycetocola sp. 2940]|uniref:lipopolysaccharide biosynthesis protein n=1 Tax=Mycetocola sp. 2940 TaxID=3156452 RepID=UPI0033999074